MDHAYVTDIVIPVVLVLVMAGLGLGLTPRDFDQLLDQPKPTAVGVFVLILVVPVMGFGIAWALRLSEHLAVGTIIIASCPGGTASNIFTLLAKGNVALSLALTLLGGLIALATLPLFANYGIHLFSSGQSGAEVDLPVLRTIGTLFLLTVLPVVFGMLVRSWWESFAVRLERYVGVFSGFALAGIVIGNLLESQNNTMEFVKAGGPAATAVVVAGIAAGLLFSKIFGIGRKDALTIAIEAGNKNMALGLMVTLSLLKSTEMAIPITAYGMVQFVSGASLIIWGRRRHGARPLLVRRQRP